jgi:hypothetical protein
MPVLQRPLWNGDPEELRELFALSKSDRAHARCALWSHQFSWEVRLTVNGSLIRSQVSRDYAEVLTAAEEWRRAMREEGWRLTVPKRGRTDQGSIITGHQAWTSPTTS